MESLLITRKNADELEQHSQGKFLLPFYLCHKEKWSDSVSSRLQHCRGLYTILGSVLKCRNYRNLGV